MSLAKQSALFAAFVLATTSQAQSFTTVSRHWDHTTQATAGASVSSTHSGGATEDFIGSFKALPGTQGDAFANSDITYVNGPGTHTLTVDNNTAIGSHTVGVSSGSDGNATWTFDLNSLSQWTFSGTFTSTGKGSGSVALDFDDNGTWVNIASLTSTGTLNALNLGPGTYRMVVASSLFTDAPESGDPFSETMRAKASLVQPVPEPATMLGLAIGSAWLLRRRKSRRD